MLSRTVFIAIEQVSPQRSWVGTAMPLCDQSIARSRWAAEASNALPLMLMILMALSSLIQPAYFNGWINKDYATTHRNYNAETYQFIKQTEKEEVG